MPAKLDQLAAIATRLGAPGDGDLVRQGVIRPSAVIDLLAADLKDCLQPEFDCDPAPKPIRVQSLPLQQGRHWSRLRDVVLKWIDQLPRAETGGVTQVEWHFLRSNGEYFCAVRATLGELIDVYLVTVRLP